MEEVDTNTRTTASGRQQLSYSNLLR